MSAADTFVLSRSLRNTMSLVINGVWLPWLGLTIVLIWGIFWCYLQAKKKSKKNWPIVPGALPLLGHMHLIGSLPNSIHKLEYWADLYGKENGCYEIVLNGRPHIVVCREDRVMEVMIQRPVKVTRAPHVRKALLSIKAPGVFESVGEQWKEERKLVSAALNRKNTQDYMSTMLLCVSRLVNKWGQKFSEEGDKVIISISEDISNIATDAISIIGMDQDFDFLNHPTSPMATDIRNVTGIFVWRAISPFEYWRIPLIGRYLDGHSWAIARVDKLIHSVVDEFRVAYGRGDYLHKTILTKLFDVMKSEKSTLTQRRVVGNLKLLFLAGTDTTSTTLTLAIYLLAKDTEFQENLRAEADNVDFETLTIDNLFAKVPRMKAYLHEVHRFYAVPLIPLKVDKDVSFGDGVIAKGTDLIILTRYASISSISPPSNVPLGPNGEENFCFCPDRWLTMDSDSYPPTLQCISPTSSRTGGGFLNFGHGIHACPGRLYAEVFSLLTLVSLIKTYEWRLPADCPPVDIVLHTTMAPSIPIQLCLNKRNNSVTTL